MPLFTLVNEPQQQKHGATRAKMLDVEVQQSLEEKVQIIKIMQEKYFVNYSFSIVLVSSFYFDAVEVKV